MKKTIIVIGAGLTGLSAALYLTRGGFKVTLLEANETVGGRMNSRFQDGFIIDAGFQISLSSYPMLRELCYPYDDFEKRVQPRSFLSGARIFRGSNGSDIEIYNPVRHPCRFTTTIGPNRGFTNLISYRNARAALQLLPWMLGPLKPSGSSIREVIEKVDLSPDLREQFLFPFLKGVLLDPTLSVDAALAGLLLRYFALGNAVLFKDGASSVPKYLHALLPTNTIHLSVRCTGLTRETQGFSVTTEHDGHSETLFADGVIMTAPLFSHASVSTPGVSTTSANEVSAATALHGLLLETFPQIAECTKNRRSLTSRTVLYSASTPPYPEPLLTLNGSGCGEINHVAVLTNVQPTYAPPGRHLVAVCTHSGSTASGDSIKSELATWFPQGETSHWRCVDDSTINYALPSAPLLGDGYLFSDGLILAGDALSYGSQNGALFAGKRAAQCMLKYLYP